MSSTIINIVLVLIIILPMAYFMMGSKSNKKENEEFTNKAKQAGLNPEKTGVFRNAKIAIDKTQSKLCYISKLKDNELHVVDLKDIKQCEVNKIYHTESVHNQATNILKNVSIYLKSSNKTEEVIPIYDGSVDVQIGDDLLEAMDWSKIINHQIKTLA